MWDDFDEMKRLRRRMNRMFSPFWEGFATSFPDFEKGVRRPLSDFKETEDEVIVFMEIPGVSKKDIQVSVTDTHIEVRAEKSKETKKKEKGYFSESRLYRGFYKSMPLPAKVVPEKTKAHYEHGVLEITMPKADKVKKKEGKKITVT